MAKRRSASQTASIEERIAHLRDLDLIGLRTCWHNEFGRPPPEHLTHHLLFRLIAYKIQADRLGGLDADTLKVLGQIGIGAKQTGDVAKNLATVDQRRFVPPPGTVLVREWDRKSHHVMVMPGGFAWNGKTFDSLSKVAFAITGTKWNGRSARAAVVECLADEGEMPVDRAPLLDFRSSRAAVRRS